ncbi:MAG TPA: N-6 DNA methylase [Ktedonobacteraceae bacterium]|jgi:hypothetical protein
MRQHRHTVFPTIESAGALLPIDVLLRIAQQEREIGGMSAQEYHYGGEKLNEVISDAWTSLLRVWRAFQQAREHLAADDPGERLTRERWLLPLFRRLDYGQLYPVPPILLGEKQYPVSHGWQHLPIHLVGVHTGLDEVRRHALTGSRHSPSGLVQEVLNRSPDHLWGMVSNGLRLRLLRQNASLTRQAYVEFDLEAMMQGECYADFGLFWLLCQQSRVEGTGPSACWLEQWSHLAQEQGVRILDQLRDGVEAAINVLGSGFLAHPDNHDLREKLRAGRLQGQALYTQVLRLVYRLLVLFVAEDRQVLLHPQADEGARTCYVEYYSTARLRRLAGRRVGTRHHDLFCGLWLVMEQVGSATGCRPLGLPALGGFLFSREAVPDLAGCALTNRDLLDAVRSLAFTAQGPLRRSVDYQHLGSEELGSIYESLLELHPELNVEAATFTLVTASGNARKTSGSYYTPSHLIDCLLDSALMPVLAEACRQPAAEQAILALTVCDPACGSGHFLIAAAHRLAKALAAVRTGTQEPGPQERCAALRDVIGHCLYGVDLNPMAVELCKVSLWMEAIEPGKPLSFLDAHIRCGDSLLGATPALLRRGIPNEAFEPIEGDEKKVCSEFKRFNARLRAGNRSLFREDREAEIWEQQHTLVHSRLQLEGMGEDTVAELERKEAFFQEMQQSAAYETALLRAHAWCAAFVWKKTAALRPPITDEEFQDVSQHSSSLVAWRRAEIERLASQYQFFHWHLAFPEVFRVPVADEAPECERAGWSGGFAVVLGNPPWERIKIQEKEWFAVRQPAIATAPNAAVRRKMIAALQESVQPGDRDLYAAFREDQRQASGESHFVRNSQRYPLCGRGDVNTYALFAENMRWIVASTGRVGCIVPSGIATDETTSWFFRDLMETQTLVSLHSFENEALLFPDVHHATKFCLLTLTGPYQCRPAADFVFFVRQIAQLKEEERHCSLSAADIALLNPNTRTCPVLRSRRDLELAKAIYRRMPVLVDENAPEGNPWNVSFKAMFHMANASPLFCTREQLTQQGWQLSGNVFARGRERYLPLYEGKMIWQFDHRFGSYEGQTQAQANQGKLPELCEEQHVDPAFLTLPRYWVHETDIPEVIHAGRTGFPVFRDVTNASVLRTAVFSILPRVGCGDTAHVVLLAHRPACDALYLASCGASFMFDYLARQKLGGSHLKYFVMRQLPMVPPRQFAAPCPWDTALTLGDWIAPRALELTYTSWDLEAFARDCGAAGPPFRWNEERRFLLRCELDAAYFHLYGIAREDVDYIMETFRVWKEREEKQRGEYRTKRVILEIYDELQRALGSGMAYATRLVPGAADPAVAHPMSAGCA